MRNHRALLASPPTLAGYLLEVAARSSWNLAMRLIGLGLVVVGGVADNLSIVLSGAVLLGAQIVALPYATPETVRRLGVVQAKLLARFLGLAMVVIFAAVLGYREFVR